MEDLGNICVREFWNPSGGLDGLFHLYEALSGIPYDAGRGALLPGAAERPGHDPDPRRHRARRTRASRWRGTSPTATSATGPPARPSPRPPASWSTRPELPAEAAERRRLSTPPAGPLDHDVRARRSAEPFAALAGSNDVEILLQCMDRRRRYGAAIAAIELDELPVSCSGPGPSTRGRGPGELDDRHPAGTLDDAGVSAT